MFHSQSGQSAITSKLWEDGHSSAAILSNELIQRQNPGRLRERPFRTPPMRNDFPTFESVWESQKVETERGWVTIPQQKEIRGKIESHLFFWQLGGGYNLVLTQQIIQHFHDLAFYISQTG